MPKDEHETCQQFFYDEHRRLPCLEGCEYPDGSAKCLSLLQDSECIYPISRKPLEPESSSVPVKWCPGPGGCIHFRLSDYTCALKRAHKPFEFTYKFQDSMSNKIYWDFSFNGKYIMGIGIALSVISYFYVGMLKGNTLFASVFVLFGFFVAIIGYFLNRWEKL